jgi:hypothetical protein
MVHFLPIKKPIGLSFNVKQIKFIFDQWTRSEGRAKARQASLLKLK